MEMSSFKSLFSGCGGLIRTIQNIKQSQESRKVASSGAEPAESAMPCKEEK